MKVNTNRWNKIRYTLYTPFYDTVARYFSDSRKKSIESLGIKNGDKVLIIGAGTGLDLDFSPTGCEITATDITPSMVESIKRRNLILKLNLNAMAMDGQALLFPDTTFDKIILHLILAVIPDPVACIQEAERVLKPGGQITVFDKFVKKNRSVSLLRRMFNLLTNLFFSDITRYFESIAKETKLTVVSDNDANFNGNFRIIKLSK